MRVVCKVVADKHGEASYQVQGIEGPVQEEWPHKFEGDFITYAITKGTTDLTRGKDGDYLEKLALNLAMTSYDIRIRPKFVPHEGDPEQADIQIRFSTDTRDFAEGTNVLAFAYFPGQGRVQGKVVFNDNRIWTLDGKPIKAIDALKRGLVDRIDPNYPDQLLKTYNLIHVLIHELGHTLGLRHAVRGSGFKNVMDPIYSGLLELSPYDLYRLYKKYKHRIWAKWTRFDRLRRWLSIRKRRF
jgi:hypothetical protein